MPPSGVPAPVAAAAPSQLRFVSLVESGTHVLFGTRIGPYAAGENTLNRTPFGGRHEATMSVIHGRPVRSLATNREPAVGG